MCHLLDSARRSIYPVNPSVSEILGLATYSSVADIPGSIDLAVIAVYAPQVPAVLRECVQKRVKAAVIISAGFAETGEQGQKLQAEVVNIARQGGIRFIGPNSMGHVDALSQLSTLAWLEGITSGSVSVISQSGNYGELIVRHGMASGIGFSKFISTGNEADLHLEDYLEYLAQDESTRIIALYIEGLREGRRFLQLAKETTARKPIIAVKAGGTSASARAARSHTGALAGSDAVYTAAFKQAGVMRVNDNHELCDVAIALLTQPLPRNNRVAILTIGGGPGVVASEACEREGLAVATLSSSTIEKLDTCLPSRWSHGNPVDVAGMTVRKRAFLFASLWALMEDENVDAVLFQLPVILNAKRLSTILGFDDEAARAFQDMQEENLSRTAQKAKELGKPVFIVTLISDAETSAFLRRVGIPAYPSPHRVARVLHHLVWYRRYLDAAAV